MAARWLAALPSALRRLPTDQQLLGSIADEAGALRSVSRGELAGAFQRLKGLATEQSIGSPAATVQAFAAVVEAVRRCHGIELFDVQLLAGLAMARGQIAEMQTGEGKTLAAALPAFLQATGGRGVHVVTPNSYLAARDFELLAPVYRVLGCAAGLLPENAPLDRKRAAYACDVTYGTGYEFGFDYLREQIALLAGRRAPLGNRYLALLQEAPRPLPLGARRGFAIVDEIDSVLIDEACTPLVLSEAGGRASTALAAYEQTLRVAETLVLGSDFILDGIQQGSVKLTEPGRRRCYQALSGEPREHSAGPWSDRIAQALVALHVLQRDVDYVVTGNKLVFVDGATGRLCPDRAWRDGLQQLLELKEGLPVTAARTTAARMTRQRYFTRYERLAGMTGTATESRDEFQSEYALAIASIPPRLPPQRAALADRVFVDNESRLRAVEQAIKSLHETGRPLLVGCRTIDRSQQISARLARLNIPHELLNGKQSAEEAAVIARAGRLRAITIATNMAGRGTDIKLDSGVAARGGLHLIAIERNLSRRVDRQLAGRVGRQGDRGSYQFFIAADDPLLERFGPALGRQIRAMANSAGEAFGDVSRSLTAVQRRAEAASRQARRQLAAADTWLRDQLGLS